MKRHISWSVTSDEKGRFEDSSFLREKNQRFALVPEGDGKHPPQWQLVSHTVANTRLWHELLAGTWDGRDLEGKLAELDA